LILYEIVTGEALFSGRGFKGKLFHELQKGWRPGFPSHVNEVSRSLIEDCWSEYPDFRPSFEDIWNYLEKHDFGVVSRVNPKDVRAYVRWVCEQG
jgi:hypothetical protein